MRLLLTDVNPGHSLRGATLAFVDERIARIEGVARLAVLVVERLLSAAWAVAAGASGVDEALLRRLDATTLPVVADYVRLVRSLVLVLVYETRLLTAEESRSR